MKENPQHPAHPNTSPEPYERPISGELAAASEVGVEWG